MITPHRLMQIIAVLLVLTTAPLICKAAPANQQTITVDGVKRSFLLHTPKDVSPNKTYPLVFVLHGGGGTARQIYRSTRLSFPKIADQHGVFLVYPNAIGKIWDFGAGEISNNLTVRADDRKYFKQLLEEVQATLPIDPKRIFATGISRGGQAAYFFACSFPDQIRAIAPIAMPIPDFMVSTCNANADIGLALLNGTEDPIVPYDGGQITVRGVERGLVRSTDNTLQLWRARNGCSHRPSATEKIDKESDGTNVERIDWTDCTGASVRLYRINHGGHTWPSGGRSLPERLVGLMTHDIDAAVEAWDFFSTF